MQIQAVQVQVAPQWNSSEEMCEEYTPYVPDVEEQAWRDGLPMRVDREEVTTPREEPVAKMAQREQRTGDRRQEDTSVWRRAEGEVGEVDSEVGRKDDWGDKVATEIAAALSHQPKSRKSIPHLGQCDP